MHFARSFLFFVLAFALVTTGLSVDETFAGTIKGVVKLKGKRPKRKRLRMAADPFCKGAHKKSPRNDAILVKKQKIQNAFVFVKGGLSDAQKSGATKKVEATLDQNGCLYSPKILGVMAGVPFKVKNSDSTLHNVNAKPKENQGFNLAMPTKNQEMEKSFAKPEMEIRVKCDVHPWMESYIHVMDHPYFATTDEEGAFEITGLPDGKYDIEVWHQKFGVVNSTVAVSGDATQDFEMTK